MDNNNVTKSVRTYRLNDETIEQLQELSEYYVRTMSEQIEWMVRETYRTMLIKKSEVKPYDTESGTGQ